MTPFRHCEGGAFPPEAISKHAYEIASSGYRPPRNDKKLWLFNSHKILDLENMRLAFAQFVRDDAAIVRVNKIVIVVNEGLGNIAINRKNIIVWRELGAVQAELFAGRPAEFSVGGDIRVKDGLTHFVEIFKVFHQVPTLADLIPIHIHMHRGRFDEITFGAEGFA